MDDGLLSGQRILVVEDEMLVLMAIEDMLTDLGCRSISVAGNIEKAMELISTKRFDLATLDVNLDGQRSCSIAQALSDLGVPFALSTGYGEHGIGEGFGDRPVLNKPFGSPELTKVLAALLSPAGDSSTLTV